MNANFSLNFIESSHKPSIKSPISSESSLGHFLERRKNDNEEVSFHSSNYSISCRSPTDHILKNSFSIQEKNDSICRSSLNPVKNDSFISICKSSPFEKIKTQFSKFKPLERKRNFYDVITNLFLAKKFINVLERITSMKPKFLGKNHFDWIDDKSFEFSAHQKNHFEKIQLFDHLTLNIPVFLPYSRFIIFWNSLNIFIFSILFIKIPIWLTFQIDIMNENFNLSKSDQILVHFIIIIIYFLDILINFNLSYYREGQLITKKSEIAKNYLRNNFCLDFFIILIMLIWNIGNVYENNSSTANYLTLFYFMKIWRIKKIFNEIEELFVVNENYYNIFSLFILLIRIFIVSHIAACVWFSLSELSNDGWIKHTENLDLTNWYSKYLYSFYFVIITLNTIGYGDITPINEYEIVFCIIFVVIGCMMFAYTLNCFGTIFYSFYKKDREFREELFLINSFMQTKEISNSSQIKVRKYLEHNLRAEKQNNFENARKVFEKLSKSLKHELLLEANGPIVDKIRVFTSNFSKDCLKEIVNIMREENFPPGEIIFKPNDYKNRDLFFIKKGSIQIFVENNSEKNNPELKTLKILKSGDIFGEITFFSDIARSAGAKSAEFTTLVRFDQNEFKQIIKENEKDWEKYHYIKDNINLYSNFDNLHIKCYSCNQKDHIITNCPKLHKFFFSNLIIRKYNYSIAQERNHLNRKKKKERLYNEIENSQFGKKRRILFDLPENDEDSELEDREVDELNPPQIFNNETYKMKSYESIPQNSQNELQNYSEDFSYKQIELADSPGLRANKLNNEDRKKTSSTIKLKEG